MKETEDPAVLQRLVEQSALLAASIAVSSSLDLTTVLNELAVQMSGALDVTSVYICDWKPETDESTVLAEYFAPDASDRERESDLGVTYHLRHDFDQDNAWLKQGKPQLIHIDDPDVAETEHVHLARYGAQSALIIPFMVQGKAIGYAELWESRRRRDFTPAEITLAQGIARQGAIAIEHARLFDQAQREIVERKRAEEKYRTLIEQSTDAIYLIHGDRFEIVNRKFAEFFGVAQKDVNALDFVFTKIIAPKSRRVARGVQAKLEQVRETGQPPKVSPVYEFTALHKAGHEIEVELTVSYPMYKGKLAIQGILRDITERKQAEAERAAMQAQMFQSAKLASVGELAAGVAHEINNPIFAIREYADLILEEISPDHPHYSMLETVIKEADRVADIVHNLLEFSRPSESDFNQVHLRDIWQLVDNLIGQSILRHNIHLEVDIPDDLPPIQARGQQIQQVILNLVTNARDALKEKYPEKESHPQKRITIKASVTEDTSALAHLPDKERPEKVMQLVVRDEGIGISAENREHLFTPFFTTKRARGGTGLGLSISHKIIEEHKGQIQVESQPGQFTAFIVTLPVVS